MVAMPPDPPEEDRGARPVSPVQFLETPPPPELPVGTVHPSESVSHSFTLNDQPVEEVEADDIAEYGDSEPLLVETTLNAPKGNSIDP